MSTALPLANNTKNSKENLDSTPSDWQHACIQRHHMKSMLIEQQDSQSMVIMQMIVVRLIKNKYWSADRYNKSTKIKWCHKIAYGPSNVIGANQPSSLIPSISVLSHTFMVNGYSHFYRRALLETSNYLMDLIEDYLKIHCVVRVVVFATYFPKMHSIRISKPEIRSNSGMLLEDMVGSDINFKMTEDQFHAHKSEQDGGDHEIVIAMKTNVFKVFLSSRIRVQTDNLRKPFFPDPNKFVVLIDSMILAPKLEQMDRQDSDGGNEPATSRREGERRRSNESETWAVHCGNCC
ncbi:hypothetical protein Ccrd_024536 [Cynara cardunculus var. scolymus]|uniref:Uncharacterized protein n=1 Tax=Cynara cardunculus var. scolymus TaxID=59895 RepID=A0A103XC92_CYNCS|nr:hypothetical protein Ccrd_024536 [Cynara cardunculus var. scolymus]